MLDGETRRYIRDEIDRALNIILSSAKGRTDTVERETILALYPGMDETTSRPIMHPYGLASKAPPQTINVNAKVGDHPASRIVLGHRDKLRPDDIQDGETVIYAADGQTVLRRVDLQAGKITIGSRGANQPLALGDVLREFLKLWLRAWLDDDYIGVCAVGEVFLKPTIRVKFEEYIQTYIDEIETNIVSQENFTERKVE